MNFSLFLLLTALLASSPGIVLLFADTEASQILALLIFLLVGAIVTLGVLGKPSQKAVWMILGIALFVFVFSSGYVSLFVDLAPLNSIEITELAGSILLVEVSLVSAMVSSSYGKYMKEWSKSGFDLDEMSSEFSRLGNFSIMLILAIAAFSGGAYILINTLPSVSIDPITGLVVAVVVCFLIAGFVLNQRGQQNENICPNCHNPVRPNDSFCTRCGAKLNDGVQKGYLRTPGGGK